jgi:hypothetical protein
VLGVPKLGVELPNSPLEGKGVEPNNPPEELAAEAADDKYKTDSLRKLFVKPTEIPENVNTAYGTNTA